jgi:[protein-PII] uridylyltransferase
LASVRGIATDDLIIAALAADVCAGADDAAQCALSLTQRLVTGSDAERIAAIVVDAHLLRAGAHDPEMFDRTEILQLATHLASTAHARDAYELALAIGSLPRWQREALDERLALVTAALEHPELTGSEANNLAGARRIAAEHLVTEPAAIERLRFAGNSYLLSHEPDELARQAELLEPLPRSGSVRVAVGPLPERDRWKVDVACRDVDGLLARLTEVLTQHGLDIVGANIATWPDGAVLDSFVVVSRQRPSAKQLALAFEAGLDMRLSPVAMSTLSIEFDNTALPWHTSVAVTGPDRPGALLAVASAFATADVVLHSARISTSDDQVNDRFAVSDRLGRKLDTVAMDRVRLALVEGRTARRVRRRR